MALEVVVRPVVFPNIRPQSARMLVPDEDRGLFTMKGSAPKTMNVSRTWSVNVSRQLPHTENTRVYDVERVYQEDDEGNINKDNFIDVERLKRVRFETGNEPLKVNYTNPPPAPNVEKIETDSVRKS